MKRENCIRESSRRQKEKKKGGGGVDNISCGGVYHLTSDIFFKYKDKNLKFDIIFIDGDHTYDQLQKYVTNALGSLNDSGVIFIHDLLPRNHLESSEIQKSFTWHGAIWKVAVELSEHPDLIFRIVNIDRGLGILKKKIIRNI
jgi:predicted O-methyltransferase YrrM